MHLKAKLFSIILVCLMSVTSYGSAQDTLQAHQWLQEAQQKIATQELEEVIPLVEKVDRYISDCKLSTNGLAEKIENLGLALFQNNLYTETIQCFRLAIRLFTCTVGEISEPVDRLYLNMGVILRYDGRLRESLNAFEKSLDLKKQLYDSTSQGIAMAYSNLGVVQSDLGDLDGALESYQRALQIKEKTAGKKSETYLTTLVNIGALYFEKHNLFKAKNILTESLAQSEGVLPENHSLLGVIFSNLASIASYESDFKRSVELHKKAIDIKLNEYGENSYAVAEAYANLGGTYYAWGQLENSEEYNLRSLQIKKEVLEPDHYLIASSYYHLGSIYTLRGSFDRAINMFQDAAEIFERLNTGHYLLADTYYNIGYTYFKAGEYDQANTFFDKSLAIALKNQGSFSANAVSAYLRKAQISEMNQRFSLAISQLDSAIYFSGFTRKENRPVEMVGHRDLLDAIILKATILLNNEGLNPDINALWELLNQAQGVENAIRMGYREEISKQEFSRQSHFLYEMLLTTGARLDFHIDDPETMFSLSEASKAIILLDAVRDSKAKTFAGISEQLLFTEDSMKVEISYLENQLREINTLGPDSTSLSLNRKLIDRKLAYENFIEKLKNENAKYLELKQSSPLEVSYIRDRLLSKDRGILEFFVGQETIFAFLLTVDNLVVKKIQRDFPLEEWIHSFSTGVSNLNTLKLPEAMDAGYKLYEKLIAPFGTAIPPKLMIVPDGPLTRIPFEALTKSPLTPDNKLNPAQYPFLVYEYHISYCYSANLLKEMVSDRKYIPDKYYLGIAPFYESVKSAAHLPPLLQSKYEIENIKNLFDSDKSEVLLGENANKVTFLNKAKNYRIVHLSTHVIIDDIEPENTYIAFSPISTDDYKVFLTDIYDLQLATDLMVLSACETASGQLNSGEGALSIARAFAYAGVKNIVSTLWKMVDDEKSVNLLKDFYQESVNGKLSKDTALRNAKIKLLRSAQNDPVMAHPYFWSGIIIIGDIQPLE